MLLFVFVVVIGGGGVVAEFDKSKQEEDEEKKKKAKMSKLNHKNGNHGDGKLEEQGLIDPNENKIGGRVIYSHFHSFEFSLHSFTL